jgi:uncharacterized protein
VIAVDTNVLIYAHRADNAWHAQALSALKKLAEGPLPWGIPSPCLAEFLAIVTGFRGAIQPTPLVDSLSQAAEWLRAPHASLLHSGTGHADVLFDLAKAANLKGGQFHDARIAAICIENGVTELWTADRDFSRFPQLKTRNPLVVV